MITRETIEEKLLGLYRETGAGEFFNMPLVGVEARGKSETGAV